jgi:hypothetical protein
VGERVTASKRVTWAGIVLITLTGLLNFHVPHFLVESPRVAGPGSSLLELVFLANLLGALAAAVGIARHRRWGWLLGVLIAGVSALLYVAQETVGLPGLPQRWLEPSRILALIVEATFVALARSQLASLEGESSPRRPAKT